MPVWGDLMQSLHKDSQHSSMLVDQRIKNLTDYLKQIQSDYGIDPFELLYSAS